MADPILAHERVTGSAEPEQWLYVLHGIYGAGRNWGSVARRIVRERVDWGVLLVDLRQHGGSQGFPPPHTLAAAAADLTALAAATGTPPSAMLGHSFGGKVALRFAADAPGGLRQLWVVDSTPSAHPPAGSAWRMLEIVRSLPGRFPSRDAAIERLIADGGLEPRTAQWMATNLEPDDSGYRWRFDTDALEALMRDFFRTDLWAVVESPPAGLELHFIKASESSVLGPEDVARLERAGGDGRVHVHQIDGGHWLNADNPDALVELIAAALP